MCVDGCGCGCAMLKEGTGCRVERLHGPSAVLFPSNLGPGCSRGGSEGARVVAPAGGGLGPPRVDV